jgi:hypothetical protein
MLLEEEASDPLVSSVRLRLSSTNTPKAELSELVKVLVSATESLAEIV